MDRYDAVVIISTSNDVYYNLAVERLLTEKAQNTAFLYLWQSKNAVVIGLNQNPYLQCNLQNIMRDGVSLARRQTGGGAVYHDSGNLNFSFITPTAFYNQNGNFETVLCALNKLGVNACISGRNDILVNGNKISGNAFYKGKKNCLHHGTLLISSNKEKFDLYLTPTKKKLQKNGVTSVKSRVINLSEINSEITPKVLITNLYGAFCEKYPNAKLKNASDFLLSEEIEKQLQEISSGDFLYSKWLNFNPKNGKHFSWGEFNFCGLFEEDGKIRDLQIQTDCMFTETVEKVRQSFIGKFPCEVKLYENISSEQDEIYNDMIAFIKESL